MMVARNLVLKAEVNALEEQGQIDRYLMDTFHVTYDDIRRIRSNHRMRERLLAATEILRDRLSSAGIDELVIPAQFTMYNLGLLIKDESLKSNPSALVHNVLKREYREQRDRVQELTGLSPTYTQLLREEFDIYLGNLYDAYKAWQHKGGFSVSDDDWLKSVRIPTELGLEEAVLLGIFLAQGEIHRHEEDEEHHRLELWGRDIDFKFYEDTILPMIRRVHHEIPMNISEQVEERVRSAMARGEEVSQFSYNLPGYAITSLAIVSWLKNCFDFSTDSRRVNIPELDAEEHRRGLLAGLVSSDARLFIYQSPQKTTVVVNNIIDRGYLESFENLARSLGYSPSIRGRAKPSLVFNKRDLRKMVDEGVIIHPYHIEQCKALN